MASRNSHHRRLAIPPEKIMRPNLVVASIFLTLLLPTPSHAASGWKKATEKDPLSGGAITFIRGYSGAGESLRLFDVIRVDNSFFFRFVVPQLASPIVQGSTIKAPEELGTGLRWSVDGKTPRTANDLRYSRKKAAIVNTADYEATWPAGCDELRELAIGGTLRIVTPNFSAEIPLRGFTTYLEKVYDITQQALISRTASICAAAAPTPPQN
jgi:hypothetical protein